MNLKLQHQMLTSVLSVIAWLSTTFLCASPVGNSLLPAAIKSFARDSFLCSSDTLSILFTGDLMQHKSQINAARRGTGNYDYRECFQYVSPELRDADLTVGNLEVTFGGKPYCGYPAFSAPDAYLKAIQYAGFDLLLFANNHCLDRGSRGTLRTLRLLDSLKIIHTGVFKHQEDRENRYPLLVERKGFRIVFLNYTYGTNGVRPSPPLIVNYIDKDLIRKDVVKARLMKPDAIIACMHWGIEYELMPRKQEKDLVKYLLDLGVDHVIGGHPHVVQPLEIIEDSLSPSRHLVAYSLGNFISNMSANYTDGGMVVRLVLKKVGRHTRIIDCGYSYVWTSRPEMNCKGQFYVYPSNVDENLMNMKEKKCKRNFIEGVRKIIEKYSIGIKEYFF